VADRRLKLPERRSLGDQIYELLRDDIVYIRLEPGAMIYENEIAERLGVSRTPVREAFRLLANEQLIVIEPQRGTRVAPISASKVTEAWFVRERLEVGAFRQAAARWNEAIEAQCDRQMDSLLEQQAEAARERDALRLLKLDEDMHRLIIEITGNQTLLQVVMQMRAHINRVRYLALTISGKERLERIVCEHQEILQAIRKGDAVRTEQLLESHLSKLNDELPEIRSRYGAYFAD
jgi:DNA-binding GntR family transcriptional regulator